MLLSVSSLEENCELGQLPSHVKNIYAANSYDCVETYGTDTEGNKGVLPSDVQKAIRLPRNNRVPGEDETVGELINYAENPLEEALK